MNLLRAAEFKVGLLVITVASLIAYMSMQVSEDPSYLGRANEAWFHISDASGLVKNSAVKTAGIPIGIIKAIKLEDGVARVELTMKPDVKLTESAVVSTRSAGILGDKFVDVYLGNPDDPPLASGGQIVNVKDKGSLDNVIAQVGDIAGSLKDVSKSLQEAVTGDGTRKHVLGRIVSNIEKLTQDISDMTGANKERINSILARLDSVAKNVDEISDKINRGEGTIGKLINDEETAEQLGSAIEGVNNFVGGADQLQTALDFHSEYLNNLGEAKTTVGIRLQPGLDRYYYIGIVDDPAGVVKTEDKSITSGGSTTDSTEVTTYRNELKFNLQFAKTFYDVTVRAGIFENSGGVGFDYAFYHNQFKFTVEAFDFSQLNLRSQLQYNFYRGLYLNAGVSDAFNKGRKYSSYLGAGLYLTNDDLKLLMTKIPM